MKLLELNIWQLSAVAAAAAAFALLCQCVNEDAKSYYSVSDFTTCDLCRKLELKPKRLQGQATFDGGESGVWRYEFRDDICWMPAHPVTASPQSAPSCLFNWQIRIKTYTCCYATCPVLQKKKKKKLDAGN